MIKVLGHSTCSYCKQAIQYLATKGKSFTYLDAREPEQATLIEQLKAGGVNEVPQIWIDGKRIGGFDKLKEVL